MPTKKQATHKKTKRYTGQTTAIMPDGEVIPMQVQSITDSDFSFHKVWLRNLITSLEDISNQKLKLAFWIIDHLNSENQLIMTQEVIAQKSGISIGTVKETMKRLQGKGENGGSVPFLVKINSGAYQVNPDVIFKGSHGKRMGILLEYSENVTTEEKRAKRAQKIAEAVAKMDAEDAADAPVAGQMAFDGA